jgi:hypothetical protein
MDIGISSATLTKYSQISFLRLPFQNSQTDHAESVSHYWSLHSQFPISWIRCSVLFPKVTGEALGVFEDIWFHTFCFPMVTGEIR